MSGAPWILNITVRLNESSNNVSTVETKTENLPLLALLGLAIVALYGTVGNILIIGAVTLKRLLRKRSNVFVVNLAWADLLICVYIMPLGLVTSQLEPVTLNEVFCNFNGFILTTCCGVSIQAMMLIAIERYFHICRISQYRKLFTTPRVSVLTVVIWIYVCMWSVQGFTGWTRYRYNPYAHLCLLDITYSLSFNISIVFFIIIIPVLVIGFCYFSIFRLVYKNRKVMQNHKTSLRSQHKPPNDYYCSKRQRKKENKELNVAFLLLTIIVLFVIFWSPVAFVVIGNHFLDIPYVVYTIATWMALSNSSVNSLVYGILNRNFRLGYISFVNKCCKCVSEDETRSGWELSNIGNQRVTKSYASEGMPPFRSRPSTTSLGIMLETTQSAISDKSSPKYGMFLDVPFPVNKKVLRRTPSVPRQSEYPDKFAIPDTTDTLLPKIRVDVCTPSDELPSQSPVPTPV